MLWADLEKTKVCCKGHSDAFEVNMLIVTDESSDKGALQRVDTCYRTSATLFQQIPPMWIIMHAHLSEPNKIVITQGFFSFQSNKAKPSVSSVKHS